jgi:hypothetical protein
MQNTVAKKSAVREDVDCDWLFASFLQNAGFGSIGKAALNAGLRSTSCGNWRAQ